MKDKGYRIPETINPGETTCIRVYVPTDTLYLGAFWQSYEFLTKWVAWERDAAHRAKDVAAVWKQAFDQARTEYEAGGGCGIMDVRQDTEHPCKLEKLQGGEWEQFANLSLCPAGQYQYPTPPQGSTSEKAVASDIVTLFQFAMQNLCDYFTQNQARIWINRAAYSWLGTAFGNLDISIAIDAMISELAKHTEQERQDALDDADWQAVYDKFACTASDQGSWSDEAVDYILGFLNTSENIIIYALNRFLNYVGTGTNFTRLAGIAHGAGSGGSGFDEPDCEWAHTFHLTNDDGGFTVEYCPAYTDDVFPGTYVAEAGWLSELDGYVEGDYHYKGNNVTVALRWVGAPTFIKKIYVTIVLPDSTFRGVRLFPTPFGEGLLPSTIWVTWAGAEAPVGEHTYEFELNASVNDFGIAVHTTNGGDDGGSASLITNVEVTGTGINPFV